MIELSLENYCNSHVWASGLKPTRKILMSFPTMFSTQADILFHFTFPFFWKKVWSLLFGVTCLCWPTQVECILQLISLNTSHQPRVGKQQFIILWTDIPRWKMLVGYNWQFIHKLLLQEANLISVLVSLFIHLIEKVFEKNKQYQTYTCYLMSVLNNKVSLPQHMI